MRISVVSSLYNSAPYIAEFYTRVKAVVEKFTDDYEIVFVNDGSPDDSLDRALTLYRQNHRVKIFDFSRNFGHHQAMLFGLKQADGDYVFLLDSDLEEEPELFLDFWERMHQADQPDVVYALQTKRKGSKLDDLSGKLFYWLFNHLSHIQVPPNVVTARLLRGHFTSQLRHFNPREVYIAALIASIGYHQVGIPVKKLEHSPTTYTLRRKVDLFFHALTSTSSLPLRYLFFMGIFLLSLCCLVIFHYLFLYFTLNMHVQGWTSLILSIWFFSGLILFSIGLCALYIGKIFHEIKSYPENVVRRVYDHKTRHDDQENSRILHSDYSKPWPLSPGSGMERS